MLKRIKKWLPSQYACARALGRFFTTVIIIILSSGVLGLVFYQPLIMFMLLVVTIAFVVYAKYLDGVIQDEELERALANAEKRNNYVNDLLEIHKRNKLIRREREVAKAKIEKMMSDDKLKEHREAEL